MALPPSTPSFEPLWSFVRSWICEVIFPLQSLLILFLLPEFPGSSRTGFSSVLTASSPKKPLLIHECQLLPLSVRRPIITFILTCHTLYLCICSLPILPLSILLTYTKCGYSFFCNLYLQHPYPSPSFLSLCTCQHCTFCFFRLRTYFTFWKLTTYLCFEMKCYGRRNAQQITDRSLCINAKMSSPLCRDDTDWLGQASFFITSSTCLQCTQKKTRGWI